MPSLLMGCGHSREKKIHVVGDPDWKLPLVTLDMGTNVGADIIWNLDNRPLPFDDDFFDEMGAYDVLEHVGKQGDWKGFFDEFAEYHRILKPGGTFGIIVPLGGDAFADPGHTRFMTQNYFTFLGQENYDLNLQKNTPMTDYRWYWKKNFQVLSFNDLGHHLGVMLRKPDGPNDTFRRAA